MSGREVPNREARRGYRPGAFGSVPSAHSRRLLPTFPSASQVEGGALARTELSPLAATVTDVKDVQTFGRRAVEAVIISLLCAGALWLFENPVGAGEVVDRAVVFVGQIDPIWATIAAWIAGILFALVVGIVLLQMTAWGFGWSSSLMPIAGLSMVFALVATSLWMCAAENSWGLVPAALAVWLAARIVVRLGQAWNRFWNPAIV